MNTSGSSISLAGDWRFAIDRNDSGLADRWFANPITADSIKLPGSMAENGKGDEVTPETPWTGRIRDLSYFEDPRYEPYRQPGNIKFPCWLTPLKFYKGVAWYQRGVEIPKDWENKVLHLSLERPHWVTSVWVDGEAFGSRDSLGTPHVYEISGLEPGNHTITIRIDNRLVIDVGEDAHSMTDHSQTSWNGIIGDILLTATSTTWISDAQVYPKPDRSAVEAVVTVQSDVPTDCVIVFEIRDKRTQEIVSSGTESKITAGFGETSVAVTVPVQKPVEAWDEFNPAVYQLAVSLSKDRNKFHWISTDFGFRTFTARSTRLHVNDRPVFLRGTLECAVFPLTGYPPTDKSAWERILRIAKDHGLNHIRFHSWCPPRAAFEAADEAGIIFSVEASSWAVVGENEEYDQWLYRETDEMLREYGNHPSFCMMLYGNEPYGDNAAEFLGKWVNHYKAKDHRRLFSSGTAWPLIPESQFHVWMNPRIMLWDQNLDSRINAKPPETITDYTEINSEYPQPIISHEIGQWCAYPNFDEIKKYTGVLRAYNFEIFRDFLEANGMGDQARDFLVASGKLQVLCYKEEIESALRTPGMAGFQLLDLHDFPGQGTALVGVLDAFWDEKGYVTPEEYRRFCSSIVPLVKIAKRVFTNDEIFSAEVLLAHFADDALPESDVKWRIQGGEKSYVGSISIPVLSAGKLYKAGNVSQSLSDEVKPIKLTLEVSVPGTTARNDWDVWVYPTNLDLNRPANVHVTGELDEQALSVLNSGGRVVLMPEADQVLGDAKGQVPAGFSSIFWNTAWTHGQQPHTLGILCDPDHPALSEFPTEFHSNWQWWYIINRSRSMIMNSLPVELRPVVQVIDDWFTARRLGLLFECQFEGGSLLVSSVDCKNVSDLDPVCRQWLYSILKYAGGDNFAPKIVVTRNQLEAVLQLN